jgi:hypothetical protein
MFHLIRVCSLVASFSGAEAYAITTHSMANCLERQRQRAPVDDDRSDGPITSYDGRVTSYASSAMKKINLFTQMESARTPTPLGLAWPRCALVTTLPR